MFFKRIIISFNIFFSNIIKYKLIIHIAYNIMQKITLNHIIILSIFIFIYIIGMQIIIIIIHKTNNLFTVIFFGNFVIYLGTKNNIELYGEFVNLSEAGYILTDETMKTRTDKMYAIGDIREKNVRQVATATNDGVIATTFILKEILKSKKK